MACESVLGDRALVAGDRLLTAHFDLPSTRDAPGLARRLVADTLCGAGAPAGAALVSHTAQLLVSELVTSAVVHAGTELHLGISGDAGTLLFAVADAHPDPPPHARTAGSSGGEADVDYQEFERGIEIIVGLAADFGWRRRDGGAGKVMWFTLTLATEDRPGGYTAPIP